jgi:hypothetical protein
MGKRKTTITGATGAGGHIFYLKLSKPDRQNEVLCPPPIGSGIPPQKWTLFFPLQGNTFLFVDCEYIYPFNKITMMGKEVPRDALSSCWAPLL